MSGVSNNNGLGGLTGAGTHLLDVLHDVKALHHLPENHVLSVEPLRLNGADEELRPVRARSGVCHRKNAGARVLLYEVLVRELRSVDGLATGAVSGGEVTALAHEVGNDAVEGGALVVEGLAAAAHALLAGAKGAEILGGARGRVGVQLHHYATGRLASDGHVEVDLRVRHRCNFQGIQQKRANESWLLC